MCIELARPTVTTTTTTARRRKPRRPAPTPAPAALAASAAPLPAYAKNVEGLVRAFEDATLAREDWTHAAHLVVALVYAHRHRLDAYTRLREAIKRYNRATGTPETPTRGYHETITAAWFHLVLHFLDLFDDGRPLAHLVDDLVQVYGRDELFAHFSRERLMTPEARAGWVEPDLKPLPALEPFTPEDNRWLKAHAEAARTAPPVVAATPVLV